MTAKIETPELDRRADALVAQPVNDTLTAFYDWLEASGIVLARYGAMKSRSTKCSHCRGRGVDLTALTPRHRQLMVQGALADHEWPKCEHCNDGWVTNEYADENSLAPIHESPTRLFADFLDLDLAKMDEEQNAMLDVLGGLAPKGYELVGDTWKRVVV